MQKEYSSLLSFTVTDINSTVTKLKALGAQLDSPIKYEIHGKVTIHLIKHSKLLVIKAFDTKWIRSLCDQVAAVRCIDGHILGLYKPA